MEENISDIILNSEPREAIRIFDELAEDLQKVTVKDFVEYHFKKQIDAVRQRGDSTNKNQ